MLEKRGKMPTRCTKSFFFPPTTGQRAEGEVIELSGAKLEGLNRGFLNLFVLSIQ